MKRFLLLLFILYVNDVFSQPWLNRVWPLGYACCGYPGFGTINMKFDSSTGITFQSVQRHQYLDATNGSACDSNCNLLFTSNGYYVANSSDDTMANGGGLNPSYYTSQHAHGGLTLPQANLVIPSLTNPNQYLLFHNTVDDYFNSLASFYFYYSIVDMSMNGGLGEIVARNNILLTDSMVPGRITACRHANGRDWWIIVPRLHTNEIIEFLYTPYGFIGPCYKPLLSYHNFYSGQCCFNPQGNYFAFLDGIDLFCDIAQFDRCTGDFYNAQRLNQTDGYALAGGVTFSPSGRYLYCTQVLKLYQYDLYASNIDSSKIIVGEDDGFMDSLGNGTQFYMGALGPDEKVYFSAVNSTPYLHVINDPDSAGLTCNFVQRGVPLPIVNGFTVPNFPNYTLGAAIGTVCDSLSNGIVELKAEDVNLFPNPVTNNLIVEFYNEKLQGILVTNLLGQEMKIASQVSPNSTVEIHCESLRQGIYFVSLYFKDRVVTRKFEKE